jgi:hypothetical protein
MISVRYRIIKINLKWITHNHFSPWLPLLMLTPKANLQAAKHQILQNRQLILTVAATLPPNSTWLSVMIMLLRWMQQCRDRFLLGLINDRRILITIWVLVWMVESKLGLIQQWLGNQCRIKTEHIMEWFLILPSMLLFLTIKSHPIMTRWSMLLF